MLRRWTARLAILAAILLGLAWLSHLGPHAPGRTPPPDVLDVRQALAPQPEASLAGVAAVCGACHAFPAPALFPRYEWAEEVERGYAFLKDSDLALEAPPMAEVARYYINHAPESIPEPTRAPVGDPAWACFERHGVRLDGAGPPLIAHVRCAPLFDAGRPDIVACDMGGGRVLALRGDAPTAPPVVLAEGLNNPAHAEVVDLDGDGVRDVLVAVLGHRFLSDERVGSVVWLRGDGAAGFAPLTIAEGLGRVADAQAADFDGDGDLDVVVAVFGYVKVGEILYLENQTSNPETPKFVPRTLDPRPGGLCVPVADLNGDGRPDFVALISQEHEVVEAFLNLGGGRFERKTIFSAGHPAFSSSSIQLVDLDGDGDLDVLLANGDVLDKKYLKPWHGIHWLENRGEYPFVAHRLDSVYGVSRAVAGDLDGDGDLDIAATTFLPGGFYQRLRASKGLDAIIVLEQTAPGTFARHTIETDSCDHPACDLGDLDGDGRLDLVTANGIFVDGSSMDIPKDLDAIVVLKGVRAARDAGSQ
jgi:hypothetical protein